MSLDEGGMRAAGNADQARRIADRLRERIVGGELAAGRPLRQERLAQEFGTSRMPVREALRLLQAEGFVEVVRNRGATVARIDLEDLQEIYELRGLCEPFALALAIPDLTDRRIAAAGALQDDLERGPLEAFGRLNKAFHMTLYEACGRGRLLSHIGLLNDAADRYLRMAIVRLDYAERSHAEHRALLDACRARDVARATELLHGHIRTAGASLVAALATAGAVREAGGRP